MKYRAGERRKAAEYEKAISEWWKKNKIFEKSVEERPVDKSYVFYDGPPFITGNPHHGTLLSSIVKDAVPRFWTMNGYRVERRWGWDCHGLPAENFVEKQLGILDRREIGTKWSLEDYILKARESMVANSETWRGTIDRIGRWVDFDNAYRTMNKDFMESVWWAFKELYDAGKIYEGRKVLMYDTKFATPVSKAEVTMDNDAYQKVTDPSAYVKFKLKGSDTYLLAWTTTPWTLPANMCLAINPDLDYGIYNINGEKLILALERAKVLFEGEKPEEAFKGKTLVGKKYEPIIKVADGLFDLGLRGDKGTILRKDTYTILPGDFVSAEDGTGIVHIAPAYGEDDYVLSLNYELDFVDCLDENGYYLPEMAEELHQLGIRDTDENGIQVWAGNKFIAKVLEEKGIVYKIEYIEHEYPFNPRSKERIIYRAFPSWFFDIDGQKKLMLDENENINWFPGYLKHGRFAKNIEQAPDWNLSRDRFWATAMPVWKGDKGSVKVVGSYAELKELSGKELEDYHRPWVDEIEFDLDGEHFTRIEKVLDCWFESGSMPFAQLHYPFENKEKFEKNYPADFIVEYVGQVRAWFYYVHAVNTALASIGAFGEKAKKGHKNAYKNVITTGTLAGNDGRKMSKSLGNFTDPNILMDQYSADALRFLLLSSPVLSGEDFALLDKDVSDVNRKLAMIWNVYDFFTTYAELEGIDSEGFEDGSLQQSAGASSHFDNDSRSESEVTSSASCRTNRCENDDCASRTLRNKSSDSYTTDNMGEDWICREINNCLETVEKDMKSYRFAEAVEVLYQTIWDKYADWFLESQKIYKNTGLLKTTLESLLIALHPFAPFVTETIWQNLSWTEGFIITAKWPEKLKYDPISAEEFENIRIIVSEIRATLTGLGGGNNAKKYDLLYDNDSLVEDNLLLIKALTKVPSINALNGAPRGLRLALANHELHLDVPEKVVADYKDALTEKILSVGRELDALNLRLMNPNYVDKAPAHLVKETRDAIKEKEALISRLKQQLEII